MFVMGHKTAEVELHYERCCGLDVHKEMIVACFRNGSKNTIEEFGTTSKELQKLAEWLISVDCEMAVMESTGSYWKPVYNILELLGLEVMVSNAREVKNLPGRKTDVNDAEWMSRLLAQGLLRPSFIPDRPQRELREVTRYRKSLTEERAREINRLGKMLEGANIKLTSIVDDVLGKNSRVLLDAAIAGEPITGVTIEGMLKGKIKGKAALLVDAMEGVLSKTQRLLIKAVLDHIDDMTRRISDLDDIIRGEMEKYDKAIRRLDTAPGIGVESAQTILAEIGLDMDQFPTAGHLAVWSGVCPGNNISAGKSKGGTTRKGNQTLRTTLVQCAQSAINTKGTFFRAQYERLVVRRGKNRAKMAVAHSMVIAIWHMLKYESDFIELGGDYYNRFNPEKKINMYLKKLAELGWTPPVPAAA
jgi:transposase